MKLLASVDIGLNPGPEQNFNIVSWIHYVVKLKITSARIETCWCWWWRQLFFPTSFSSVMVIPVITYSLKKLMCNTLAITLNVLSKAILRIHSLRSRRIKGRGVGEEEKKKTEGWRREGNACYKSRFFCISAYCFMVIGLTKLSVQWPIRIRRAVFCMTDFTREGGWKNIHNAASIVRKSSSCVMSATPKKTKDRQKTD